MTGAHGMIDEAMIARLRELRCHGNAEDDAKLIAEMRDALPALLEDLSAYKQSLEVMAGYVDERDETIASLREELDAGRARRYKAYQRCADLEIALQHILNAAEDGSVTPEWLEAEDFAALLEEEVT